MSAVRLYLPLTEEQLRRARAEGRFGPAPLAGHAVTPGLAALVGSADEEELEYAATAAAALDALALLGPGERPVRLVAALDVPAVEPVAGARVPSAVTATSEVPLRRLACVLADDPRDGSASAAVAAARDALRAGDPAAEDLAERCLDHELGWYAAQELDLLLDG